MLFKRKKQHPTQRQTTHGRQNKKKETKINKTNQRKTTKQQKIARKITEQKTHIQTQQRARNASRRSANNHPSTQNAIEYYKEQKEPKKENDYATRREIHTCMQKYTLWIHTLS